MFRDPVIIFTNQQTPVCELEETYYRVMVLIFPFEEKLDPD